MEQLAKIFTDDTLFEHSSPAYVYIHARFPTDITTPPSLSLHIEREKRGEGVRIHVGVRDRQEG